MYARVRTISHARVSNVGVAPWTLARCCHDMDTSVSQGGRQFDLPSLTYHSSVYPIPHSPEETRRRRSRRSPGPRSSSDTPLCSYVATRQRTRVQLRPRAATRESKVPLSALATVKAEPGSIGGDFKPATMVTSIQLPTLYNHHQATQRGIRSLRIHSDRYSLVRVARESFADVREERHQRQLRGERGVELARMRKAASAHVPHRADFGFYMNGRSAQLFRKGELSAEDLQRLQQSSLSPNSALYYGKGVKSGRPHSKAVQDFERKVRLATECGGGEVDDDGDMERESEQETPLPPPPSPLALSGAVDNRQTSSVFITEPNPDTK